MVSVSPCQNAMTFDLHVQRSKTLDARELLFSGEISFYPPQMQKIVAEIMTDDEKLQKAYKRNYDALVAEYGKPKDDADKIALHAGALFATIVTNREKYPPEAFSIEISIGNGKTKSLKIQEASMYAGITFKRQQMERLEQYMDDVKSRSAQESLDNSSTVSPAHSALGKMLSIISMQKAKAEGEETPETGGTEKAGKAETDAGAKDKPDLQAEEQTLVEFVRDFAKSVRDAYRAA